MHPKSPTWLHEVATRGGYIIEFATGRSETDYDDDRLLRSAIEHNLQVISHALLRINETDPATARRLSEFRSITDMDEDLIHCSTTSSQQVWPIIQELLPVLKAEAEELLREPVDRDPASPAMNSIITENLEAIRALCREYGVLRLDLFGSAATTAFDPETSDIDFIVEYPPGYEFGLLLARYFELKERLETLLGRPVDLVMAGAPRNPYFMQSINESRQLVYGA